MIQLLSTDIFTIAILDPFTIDYQMIQLLYFNLMIQLLSNVSLILMILKIAIMRMITINIYIYTYVCVCRM